MSLLGSALSGLQAFQVGLATTSNNIANVNTEGYSRQRTELLSRPGEGTGGGFIGNGVYVATVQRYYDAFVTDNLRGRTSSFNEFTAYGDIASRLQDIVADPEAGLSSSMQSFFNAIHDVAANPSSTAARQVVLSEAEALVSRFQLMNRQVDTLRGEINSQLTSAAADVSALSTSLAQLNKRIVEAQGSVGHPPNDLLDQRDEMLRQLSELVNVTVTTQSDGSASVFVGSGQALVVGSQATRMEVVRNEFDPQRYDMALIQGGTSVPVTDQLSGGRIGGLIAVRRDVLDQAQNAMGRIAVSLVNDFNTQHQLGDDMNGNPGGLFFDAVNVSSPVAMANRSNNPASGSVSVSISDYSALTASDYQLNYNGASFSLLRLSDNTVVDSGFTVGDLPRTVASEGLTLNLSGTVATGDRFLIQPTRRAASEMGVAISSVQEFAAAASGSAVGDNTNALALAALRESRLLSGGTATFQESYAEMVANIGVKARQSDINTEAQQVLLNQAVATRNGLSGVNLDEEAANLIRYQQAYQAAARLIAVSDTLFQSLLGAFRS